ncbi:MAG: N-acetyl-gamma-glutamyl-phosphate reductase [Clostridia bacterium]|nr:N-acetyl-gamma-glutamyl-phosphate reductase [Clostridia bacterium]
MTKIFIDGREGTTGLRIQQRLEGRRNLELITLPENLRKDPEARKEKINEADIAFLCLPDAAAKESAALAGDKVTVIDASTAHRVHPDWAYGFAELSPSHRAAIASGKRIANPGCHASGFIALVYPLVAAGILPKDYPLTCHSLTGYSGGGKKMIAEYESEGRNPELDSPRQYGLTQLHKHLPEMQHVPGLACAPHFSPIVSDYYAGMEVTVPLFSHLLTGSATLKTVHEAMADHYAGQKLVKVLPFGEVPGFCGSNNLAGRDSMEILVAGNDERILLVSRFDNLGKGASGAAIQCMNIALGLDEAEGLTV